MEGGLDEDTAWPIPPLVLSHSRCGVKVLAANAGRCPIGPVCDRDISVLAGRKGKGREGSKNIPSHLSGVDSVKSVAEHK